MYFPREFILSNGKYIGKNVLQQLIKLNEGNDFKLAHKISNRHISVKGTAQIIVKLAANLFSNTVAKAILF